MMVGLAADHGEEKTVMIDAIYLKARGTASSFVRAKGGRGRLIGRPKGGMNINLHTTRDSQGRPLNFFATAGQPLETLPCNTLSVSGLAMISAHGRA